MQWLVYNKRYRNFKKKSTQTVQSAATHRLCLENKELAVRTESQVRVEWSPGAVLENKTYTMEHTTLLASDHSAVILEGYEYLVKRLADRP